MDPQGNSGYFTELDIRTYLMDADPERNLLLDDQEFTPEEIRAAQTHAIDYWNDEPPDIGAATVYTFPYRSLALQGTAGTLLKMKAHLWRRNELRYSVPGGQVADQEKSRAYDGAGERLWQEFKQRVLTKKRSLNMEMGWSLVN